MLPLRQTYYLWVIYPNHIQHIEDVHTHILSISIHHPVSSHSHCIVKIHSAVCVFGVTAWLTLTQLEKAICCAGEKKRERTLVLVTEWVNRFQLLYSHRTSVAREKFRSGLILWQHTRRRWLLSLSSATCVLFHKSCLGILQKRILVLCWIYLLGQWSFEICYTWIPEKSSLWYLQINSIIKCAYTYLNTFVCMYISLSSMYI